MSDPEVPVDRGFVRPDPLVDVDQNVIDVAPDGTVERDVSPSRTGLSSDDSAGRTGAAGKDARGYHPAREFYVQDEASKAGDKERRDE